MSRAFFLKLPPKIQNRKQETLTNAKPRINKLLGFTSSHACNRLCMLKYGENFLSLIRLIMHNYYNYLCSLSRLLITSFKF